jgi:hypothetical protein
LGTQGNGDWGSSLTAADRILVKNQASTEDNGIYLAASGAWTRATDFDADSEVNAGVLVTVNEGTTLADTIFELTTNNPITVGTTGLTFTKKSIGTLSEVLALGGTTASSELSGVISDETGTGLLVFATNPALVTPTVDTSLTGILGSGLTIAAANSGGPAPGDDLILKAGDETTNGGTLYIRGGTGVTPGDIRLETAGATKLTVSGSTIEIADSIDLVLNATTGTKIGTATTQKLAFYGSTPIVQPSAYTANNVVTDRTYDANSTTIDELADVLGTLITDLKSLGLIG